MKITDIDKRRAINRLPEFKEDCLRHNKLKTEDKITRFKIDFSKKWGYEFEQILFADKRAKYLHDEPKIKVKDTPTVEAIWRINDAPYIIIHEGEEKTPSRLTGDSLYLKVTLEGKTETQLVDDFKRVIGPYRNLLQAKISAEAKKERNRKTDITAGVWAIYDLYLKTNKNMSETTRQWFKVSGNPTPRPKNNEFDVKLFKQIKKAVSNTEAIISFIRVEYDLK